MLKSRSLFDKIWDYHIVKKIEDDIFVIYIDRHYIHEVTSPQAFLELSKKNISCFRPNKIIATLDHNVPTFNHNKKISDISDKLSKKQIYCLIDNCKKFKIDNFYKLGHKYNGIVHVIGPELGHTLPGMTIVCGDSHTCTHGAFGCIAFGIGTSQISMVMATQCLLISKPKQVRINIKGEIKKEVTPKDIILYIISELGVNVGIGHVIEYTGAVFKKMSMEGRMTVCNMSIEMGAKSGLIAPDEITFKYVKNRKYGKLNSINKDNIIKYWKSLKTDKYKKFDKEYTLYAENIRPMITYGTNPGMAIPVNNYIPKYSKKNNNNKKNWDRSIQYMNFNPGTSLIGTKIEYVFIGSCTNSRIEDLRIVSSIVYGKKKSIYTSVMIVPGSNQVLEQVKKEGLDKIFIDAGLDLRNPGCSACIGMNEDKIPYGKYCVSTSNRNFEGRQGPGSKTLLVSPLTAAIIAIEGKIVDVIEYMNKNFIYEKI